MEHSQWEPVTLLSAVFSLPGEIVPKGDGGDPDVLTKVTGSKVNAVIAFSRLLIIIYAQTLAPMAWIYAAEV